MSPIAEPLSWGAREAAPFIRIPNANDDKYSHGVLGVITGSTEYPGAAVLGIEAAARTGVGMLRYRGPSEPTRLVLERRPEVVTVAGRVDAYLVGSGIDPAGLDAQRAEEISQALASGLPTVLDAGALARVADATGPTIITPHHNELVRLLAERGVSVSTSDVAKNSARWACEAADTWGVTVLLKGNVTHIVSESDERGNRFHAVVPASTTWMATAGTGDVLAGILGALVATHAEAIREDEAILGSLAATAALVHALAGSHASAGGPLVALDVAASISSAVAEIL